MIIHEGLRWIRTAQQLYRGQYTNFFYICFRFCTPSFHLRPCRSSIGPGCASVLGRELGQDVAPPRQLLQLLHPVVVAACEQRSTPHIACSAISGQDHRGSWANHGKSRSATSWPRTAPLIHSDSLIAQSEGQSAGLAVISQPARLGEAHRASR